ncbi:MAG: undecaprenyldiphospho-muramoylpentapeptide beta-N-acetylglucosaminyltransferase, partial [Anaerolineales bacterium]|nr:undecaprenyldiphospho-muramoylpentapeptide beta-N-acetylglucosaminyltransferase [Anaerolineales bacterium]
MRLLICAGGTGGGVYPALAVLQALNEHKLTGNTDDGVLWVGGEKGMEQEILSRQNIEFKTIPAAGLHGVGLKNLPCNISLLMKGYLKAGQIIREYRPDVLFFTGGYLAVPAAFAGRSIPSLVFIPDIEPGLAIKTITNLAARIAVSVDQTRMYIPAAKEVIVSGYPVRAELLKWSREKAIKTFNLNPDLPTLLVFGGSKGARSINRAIKVILSGLLQEMQVIHITGKLDFDEILANQDSLSNQELENYRVFPFLHDEMGAALRTADLVVSRSGASILGEYPMFGVPAILVPYPHTWRYQKTNAQYLADRGAAHIINDEDLGEQLLPRIKTLINNQDELLRMRSNMKLLAQPDAAGTIAQQLLSLAENASG